MFTHISLLLFLFLFDYNFLTVTASFLDIMNLLYYICEIKGVLIMSRKEIIAEAYRDLVVSKKMYKISVQEICDVCHVSRTTFYKYFRDVKDIIEYTLLQDAIIDNYHLIENEIVDTETATLNWYLSFYKHKEFYLIIIRDNGQDSLFEVVTNLLHQYNMQLYRKLYPKLDDEAVDYLSFKFAATQSMMLKKWMLDDMRVSPYKMCEYYLEGILEG